MKQRSISILRTLTLALACTMAATGLAAQESSSSSASSTQGKSGEQSKVRRADKLVGKEVFSSDKQKIGEVKDFVVDLESGRILYVVVDARNDIGVPPGILREGSDNNLHASVSKSQFDNAPEFTSAIDSPDQIKKADYVAKVYQHFGQSAWWQGSTPASQGSFNNVHKTSDLEGMNILNQNNQTVGEVNSVALDLPSGHMVYVVLEPDNDLKLGNNYYLLPPNAFSWNADQKQLIANLNRENLASAPHFASSQWPNLSDRNLISKVYRHYGKQTWFGDEGLQPTGR